MKSIYLAGFIALSLSFIASPAAADGGHASGTCRHTHEAGKTLCERGGEACTTPGNQRGTCVQRTHHCLCEARGGAELGKPGQFGATAPSAGETGEPPAMGAGQHMMGRHDAAATDPAATRKAQMVADQVEARLNAPQPDALELAKAAKTRNVDAAKRILLRNGFAPQQLEGATIVLEDKTGGGPITPESRVSVTIEVSCCPLTITIIIRL